MAGRAKLDDNLVDDLVPMVDELRADLYVDMGTRQYEVHVVRRTWSGATRNEGVPVAMIDEILTPPPLFADLTAIKLTPGGRTFEGDASLKEVSLQYTEAQLLGGVIAKNQEFYYRIIDLWGQSIAPAYYVPRGKPIPDREQTLGWIVLLNRVVVSE